MNDDYIKCLSLIKASKYRKLILESLKTEILTPSEISQKTGIRLNHVSNVLSELTELMLIECLNENAKKGRLYRLTEFGNDILKNK